ncbi:hypothetical protein M5D96_011754 [Drosophila gunungcola]|uniref:Uncharacterized protein n=1 Tax=Drosophila gunungcola TaxID=103775 RepID=A0A9Q0BKF6_9MUSC|nr:hypothetical protein M5D96_011754 [Drosophila gunungcola]
MVFTFFTLIGRHSVGLPKTLHCQKALLVFVAGRLVYTAAVNFFFVQNIFLYI